MGIQFTQHMAFQPHKAGGQVITLRRLRMALTQLIRPIATLGAVLLFLRVMSFPRPYGSPITGRYTKALVVASKSQDPVGNMLWLSDVPNDWAVHHYLTDDLRFVPAVDRGNEAMAYLTYIIDHYDSLPDVVMFRHGHLLAWHQRHFDALGEIRQFRADHVVRRGYASLRCLTACENRMTLGELTAAPAVLHTFPLDVQVASFVAELTGANDTDELPPRLAAPCCGQFAASRAAIRGRPREWWERVRRWLIETPLDSYHSGRLMEFTWHLWLGREAELCISEKECLCDLYGYGDCKGVP